MSANYEVGQLETLREEMNKRILGQERFVERLLITLLADGHVLIEGVPGLAKTRALTTLTALVGADMNRVQFTPDLLPSDLTGTEVFRPQTGEFTVRRGPVFTNFLLADEINRAPSRVQSALLQAMGEREVSLGDETYPLDTPFMVLATQNPIEQHGTYPLPEAQLDRFLMKLKVEYPAFDDELEVLRLSTREALTEDKIEAVLSVESMLAMRRDVLGLHIAPELERYIVELVRATRSPEKYDLAELVAWGASPRATIALKRCAQALAYIRQKDFVGPDEIQDVATDVLRHRIITTFEADARKVDSDEIIRILTNAISLP